jgi:hypothetical protein
MATFGEEATRKMLGDAGEHYALSRFTFSGKPAMKMPDGWRAYDLAVETGEGLARVSVKTRSESVGWKKVNGSLLMTQKSVSGSCAYSNPRKVLYAHGLSPCPLL